MLDNSKIKLIGIDGDDTLWLNEIMYQTILEKISSQIIIDKKAFFSLLKDNITIFGFGLKTYIITLTEYITSKDTISATVINEIIQIAKAEYLKKPPLISGVGVFLRKLSTNYRLALITQGDNYEQYKKIRDSKLEPFFSEIDILEEKNSHAYSNIILKHNIPPQNFLMIGNSIHSDILPVLKIGGNAIYIKSQYQWELEKDEINVPFDNFYSFDNISESLKILI